MLRRLLQRQLDAIAKGGDPLGVSFDASAPPIKFDAGNYVVDKTDERVAALLSA
jgi:hypothetical protein